MKSRSGILIFYHGIIILIFYSILISHYEHATFKLSRVSFLELNRKWLDEPRKERINIPFISLNQTRSFLKSQDYEITIGISSFLCVYSLHCTSDNRGINIQPNQFPHAPHYPLRIFPQLKKKKL